MTTRETLREELKNKLLVGWGSVSKIEHYMNTSNYLQILYTYGILALQILLEYCVYIEDYNTCAVIRDVVENHNKATGTKYKLK